MGIAYFAMQLSMLPRIVNPILRSPKPCINAKESTLCGLFARS